MQKRTDTIGVGSSMRSWSWVGSVDTTDNGGIISWNLVKEIGDWLIISFDFGACMQYYNKTQHYQNKHFKEENTNRFLLINNINIAHKLYSFLTNP